MGVVCVVYSSHTPQEGHPHYAGPRLREDEPHACTRAGPSPTYLEQEAGRL
jgi:hypothetical protein